MTEPVESAVLDEWHVLCALNDLKPAAPRHFTLLGEVLAALRSAEDTVAAWRTADAGRGPGLPIRIHCGHVWTSLGTPSHEPFPVPEFFEADRRLVYCGSFGVNVSAPRAVENFLDMAHFPFVHTDVLGVEPHTEVKDYEVSVSGDSREVVARGCRFYQPLSALSAKAGFEVEETISATLFMALVDEESTDIGLSQFQQMIFSQDKPILENQRPRRLPLEPTAETSVRADRVSVAYRRWLHERGICYGTIPRAGRLSPETAAA